MYATHLLLFLRRFRRSLFVQRPREVFCACCSASIERYEFVCSSDECQIWALSGQAMIATSQPSLNAAPRRVAYPRTKATADSLGSLPGAPLPLG
jgi:hypothetical protein